MSWALWIVLWWSAVVWAQPIVPLPIQYPQCTELAIPTAIPPTGKQLLYCKAGAGYCAKDSTGTERCTGAGGGGGGTNFTLAGDTGTPQSITDGNTLTVSGGAALTCTAQATDTVSCDIDAAGVTDAMLANNYSGVGACSANTFASTLNDNGAPTCTAPTFTAAGTSGTPQSIASGDTLTIAAGTGVTTTAGATDTVTVALATPVAVANGGTNLTTATDDNVMVGNGTTWQSKALPTTGTSGCAGTGDKLLYNTVTNTWTCGTDAGAGGGMTSFTLAGDTGSSQTISDGNTLTVATGAGLTATAGATDTVTITVDAGGITDAMLANNYSGIGACGANTFASTLSDNAAPTCTKPAFTATDSTGGPPQTIESGDTLTIASGTGITTTAGATDTITVALSVPVAVANGGTNLTTAADDNVMVGNGTTWQSKALPSCSGGTDALMYGTGGNLFTCNHDMMTFWQLNSDAGSTQTIVHADILGISGGNGLTGNAGALGTDTLRIDLDAPVFITSTAGVDCTGTSDSTTGVNNALIASAGRTVFIPAGCILRLASAPSDNAFCTGAGAPIPCCTGAGTGACHVSVKIPAGTRLFCEDSSAGFAAVRRRCVGGNYPDAACTTSAECLGGGTCSFDFGSTLYAATGSDTYVMLQDSAPGSGITIDNCSVFTYQADPYQRCTGSGGNAGDPCRQECSGGAIPGFRCETNADCIGGGTCLRTADCHGAGGTGSCSGAPCCTGAPLSAVGSGKINAIDLSRTTNVLLRGVKIRDHFKGDYGIKTFFSGTLRDSDAGAEISDCSVPAGLAGTGTPTPTNSTCFSNSSGNCCYGAAGFGSQNVQPTTAVTNDIVMPAYAGVYNTKARGSTLAFSLTTGSICDACVTLPNGSGAVITGPGTAGGGISIADQSVVSKSKVLFPASGLNGIIITAANSKVSDNYVTNIAGTASAISSTGDDAVLDSNTLAATATASTGITSSGARAKMTRNTLSGTYGTGINSTGAAAVILGNTMTGLQSAGIGIKVTGGQSSIGYNYIEGNGTTATAININGGGETSINGNHIVSNPGDTLQYGITVTSNQSDRLVIEGNTIQRVKDVAIWPKAVVTGTRIVGNNVWLQTNRPTATLQPIHVRLDDGIGSGPTQTTISDNWFLGGWRGVVTATRVDAGGLTNTNLAGNRLVSISGAPFAMGGAGVLITNNYVNSGVVGTINLAQSLTCDASCSNRGTLCQQDSNCTSCNVSAKACIPEVAFSYLQSPTAILQAAHNQFMGNLMYSAYGTAKQCQNGSGTATHVGAACFIDLSTCTGGGGTCSGGPPATCSGGTQNGKPCCAGTAGNTCTSRTDTPYIRLVDYGTGTSGIGDSIIANNVMFPNPGADNGISNMVGIDFMSSASLGNEQINRLLIAGNSMYGNGGANTTGIKWPTTFNSITDVNVNGNNMMGWTSDQTGFTGAMGDFSYPTKTISMASDQTMGSTSFANLTGLALNVDANRSYFYRCDFTWSTSDGTTSGIGQFALTAPGSPVTFNYGQELWYTTTGGTGTTSPVWQQTCNGDDCSGITAVNVAASATGTKFFARINGILNTGANAGVLQARGKNGAAGSMTIYKGSNCLAFQVP